MGEVDIFAENFTLIDWELHDLWIKGLTVTEAVVVMRERGILKVRKKKTNHYEIGKLTLVLNFRSTPA